MLAHLYGTPGKIDEIKAIAEKITNDYDKAEEAALQALSDMRAGAEILNMSNPGDYPFDEDDFNPDYRIEDFDE